VNNAKYFDGSTALWHGVFEFINSTVFSGGKSISAKLLFFIFNALDERPAIEMGVL